MSLSTTVWVTAPLGEWPIEFVDGDRSSKYPKRSELVEKGVPFLNSTNLSDGVIDRNNFSFISPEKASSIKKGKVKINDILMTTRGSVGKVAICPSWLSGALINAQMLIIRTNESKIDPFFLFHVLRGRSFQDSIKSFASGSAQPQLPIRDLKLIPFSAPDLVTQKRISSILSAYDNLIENNSRRIEILEEMAHRIYEEWFVHFRFPGHQEVKFKESELGMIPEGWEVGSLQDIVVLQRGFDLPVKKRTAGEYPIIAATGVNGFHNEFKVKGPSVVTGRSGSLGKVMFVQGEFWPLNTSLWGKLYPIGSALLAYYTLSAIDLKSFNAGAAVPTLNRNDIHSLPVVIPAPNIIETFDSQVQPLHSMIEKLKKKNSNLRAQRDLLLPKLVSGEIDVSDFPMPEQQ